MPWRAVVAADVQGRFTPSEVAMLNAAQNSTTTLATALTDVVKELVSAMAGAGYPVNNDGTLPDVLRRHVIAAAAWEWLRYYPALKAFKTDERKQGYTDYQRMFEKVCARQFGAIEAPYGTDITTGNWNSNNKIIMRTEPVPTPPQQFQSTQPNIPSYANPNAPQDVVPTTSPGLPGVPIGVVADAKPGLVRLSWLPAINAASYNIYRGTASGQELAAALALAVTGTNFADSTGTKGTTYYYKVTSVVGAIESDFSAEVSAAPQ